jgi:hypothetical protein
VLLEARSDLAAVSPPSGRDLQQTIVRLIDLYVAWGKHAQGSAIPGAAPILTERSAQ